MLLCRGKFGEVWRHADSVRKVVRGSRSLEELDAHESVSGHPNVCRLLESSATNRVVTLVLEPCCTDACQRSKERGFTGAELRSVARDMAAALRHVHDLGYMHRDVKPQNILLCHPFVAKLADFGFATDCVSRKRALMGTPNYIAPEVLDRKSTHGPAVDTWGLGVTLLGLFDGGRGPFERRWGDIENTYRRIQRLDYRKPRSEPVLRLVQKIVVLEPEREGLGWIARWGEGKL